MKRFLCTRCGRRLRVTYAGDDDGGQVRAVRSRLVKFWPPGDERKKARRYLLRLDCRTKDCDGGIEVRRRSRAEAMRTARNVQRWLRRQREAAA